jgi:hypothetical protein
MQHFAKVPGATLAGSNPALPAVGGGAEWSATGVEHRANLEVEGSSPSPPSMLPWSNWVKDAPLVKGRCGGRRPAGSSNALVLGVEAPP